MNVRNPFQEHRWICWDAVVIEIYKSSRRCALPKMYTSSRNYPTKITCVALGSFWKEKVVWAFHRCWRELKIILGIFRLEFFADQIHTYFDTTHCSTESQARLAFFNTAGNWLQSKRLVSRSKQNSNLAECELHGALSQSCAWKTELTYALSEGETVSNCEWWKAFCQGNHYFKNFILRFFEDLRTLLDLLILTCRTGATFICHCRSLFCAQCQGSVSTPLAAPVIFKAHESISCTLYNTSVWHIDPY